MDRSAHDSAVGINQQPGSVAPKASAQAGCRPVPGPDPNAAAPEPGGRSALVRRELINTVNTRTVERQSTCKGLSARGWRGAILPGWPRPHRMQPLLTDEATTVVASPDGRTCNGRRF